MLYSILKKNRREIPKKIAIICNNNTYTYTDLWVDSEKLSHWFGTNLNSKDKIGFLLDNSYEAVISIYGIVMSKRVCIPIDADMHEKNIKYILDDTSITLIITSFKYLKKVEGLNKKNKFKIILADNIKTEKNYNSINNILRNTSANQPRESENISASSTAFILYTTGSTGPKKGVMLSHENLLSATKNINEFMQIGPWAIESLPMRLSHSFGFARLRCIFDVGGTVILENGFLRPEKILYNIKLRKANAISSVPSGFAILLDYYKEQFENISCQIKYIEIGSDFMKQSHKDLIMELCPKTKICMHYGLTEGSRATFIEFFSENDKLHTVGKPSPNVEIQIISETGEKLGPNQTGEILVKGRMVTKGYFNKFDMTNKYLKDGWLKTGDIGMIDNEGYINLLGRKKDIINVGGLKVAPGEIEEILLKYEGILEAVVVGIQSPDDISSEMIVAFIVSDNELSIKNLEKFCVENMESYKLPSDFKFIESIPKTASGKILRHLLIKEYQ